MRSGDRVEATDTKSIRMTANPHRSLSTSPKLTDLSWTINRSSHFAGPKHEQRNFAPHTPLSQLTEEIRCHGELLHGFFLLFLLPLLRCQK